MIDIIYSGYSYTHEGGINFDTDMGHAGYDCYLLVFARTPAIFLTDNEIREYPAETIVLYAPGERKYYYSPEGQPYKNDWIHFKTDEKFIEKFPLKNTPFSPSDPEYIHNLIKLINWEASSDHSPSNQTIKDLFRVLMAKLTADISEEVVSPYQHELLKLRREIVQHPEYGWNVPDMAGKVNISTAHLQFLYKNAFGVPCIDDVINNRIRLAQDKLLYSTDPISVVSEQCGYHNTEHFCRQFKKIVGITPRRFRVGGNTIPKENL